MVGIHLTDTDAYQLAIEQKLLENCCVLLRVVTVPITLRATTLSILGTLRVCLFICPCKSDHLI